MLTNCDPATFENKLSLSELGTLLRCKKKYDYAYVQRLTPVNPPGYLSKGRYLHMMLEEYLRCYQNGEDLRDVGVLGATVLQQLAKMREAGDASTVVAETDRVEVNAVLEGYFERLDMSGIEVVAVEQEFLVDVGLRDTSENVVPVHGLIDAVLRNDEGVWLVEHKTASRRWSEGQFAFAYQGRVYPAVWEALTGERPVGVMYNFFLPKTTETHAVYVSESEGKALLDELQAAVALRDQFIPVREPHWGCQDCWFRSLCTAELYGGNAEQVRRTQFTLRPPKEMPEGVSD